MADLKKLVGLFILGCIPPFLFIGGPILFPILYLEWRYVRFCLKMDLIVIYLIIRIPIWLLIQLPLYSIGVASHKIENFFVAGLNKLRRAPKTSIFLLSITFVAIYFLTGTQVAIDNPQVFNIMWWYEALWGLIRTIVFTFFTVLTLLSIKEAFSGNIAQGEMPAEWSRQQLAGAPAEAVDQSIGAAKRNYDRYQQAKEMKGQAQQAGRQAKKAFNDIEMPSTGGGNLISSDLEAYLGELAEMFGLGGEGATLTASAVGWPIVAVILAALLIFVVQLFVVVGGFFLWFSSIAPAVLGPVGSALGLGADYGNWIGGEFGDRFLAGTDFGIAFDTAFIQETSARLSCVAQGPACIRKKLINNTKTPDSRNVGETYQLQLERFEVGSGDQVDVSGKNGGYKVPISFGLSNSRNGIYGIPAKNVSYRLSMVDFERGGGLGGNSEPFCETGWRPISGYNIREDVDSETYVGNDLYPGTSASTGFLRLNEITLENCGMLQPGAGQTRTVKLEVKYDYSSEATLYFEAMSRQTLQQRPDVTIEWKASETADTPVKSVLNVNSPVLYNGDRIGTEQAAIPFSMRSRLITETSDVEYKVRNMEISQSREVKKSDQAFSCQFQQKQGEEDTLVPTSDAEDQLYDKWFSSGNPPSFLGCRMELENPQDINPTGQTLSMDVRSNYTVKLNQEIDRFRLLNSRCGSLNCPLLVTQQFAEERERPKNWKIQCTGPDSTDGCSVVKGDPEEWSTPDYITQSPDIGINDTLDSKLEQGEYAYDPGQSGLGSALVDDWKSEVDYEDRGAAIGLSGFQINRIEGRTSQEGFAVLSVIEKEQGVRSSGTEREIVFRELDTKLCRFNQGSYYDRYRQQLAGENEQPPEDPFGKSTYVVAMRPEFKKNCG